MEVLKEESNMFMVASSRSDWETLHDARLTCGCEDSIQADSSHDATSPNNSRSPENQFIYTDNMWVGISAFPVLVSTNKKGKEDRASLNYAEMKQIYTYIINLPVSRYWAQMCHTLGIIYMPANICLPFHDCFKVVFCCDVSKWRILHLVCNSSCYHYNF